MKTPLFCDLLLRPTERPSIKRSGRRSRGGGFAECGKVERGTVKWEVVARRRRRRRNGLMVGPQSRTVGSPDGPAEIPLLSPGHSQNRFPYEREERWFPKRSPGQAGRPHFRRPKLAFLTGVDRTPRKELFPGAVDGWDLISLDCSGLDEGHGEDRGSGWTSEAHAGTTPSRGPTITGLADDQAWLVEGSTTHSTSSAFVRHWFGESCSKRERDKARNG